MRNLLTDTATALMTLLILSLAMLQLLPLRIVSYTLILLSQAIARGPSQSTKRGRLVLLAVDETSLEAVKWSVRELLCDQDFVHILHINEEAHKKNSQLANIYFTSEDYSAVRLLVAK